MLPMPGTTCRNYSSRGGARMNGRQSVVEMVGRWVFLFFGNAGPDSTVSVQQFGLAGPDGAELGEEYGVSLDALSSNRCEWWQ